MNYIIYNNTNYKNGIDDYEFHNLLDKEKFLFLNNRVTFVDIDKNIINSINTKDDSIITFQKEISEGDNFFISYSGNYSQFDNTRMLIYSLELIQKSMNIRIFSTPSFINFINNKYLLNKFCKKYNINSPKTIYLPGYNTHNNAIKNSTLLSGIVEELKFPIIIKPVAASGGLACSKVNDINQLRVLAEYISFTGYGIVFQEYINVDYEFRVVTAGNKIFDHHEHHGLLYYRPTENEFRSRFNTWEFREKMEQDEIEFIQNFLNKLNENYNNIAQLGLDIIRGKDGKLYFLEANSLPGMVGYYKQFSEWINLQ